MTSANYMYLPRTPTFNVGKTEVSENQKCVQSHDGSRTERRVVIGALKVAFWSHFLSDHPIGYELRLPPQPGNADHRLADQPEVEVNEISMCVKKIEKCMSTLHAFSDHGKRIEP